MITYHYGMTISRPRQYAIVATEDTKLTFWQKARYAAGLGVLFGICIGALIASPALFLFAAAFGMLIGVAGAKK